MIATRDEAGPFDFELPPELIAQRPHPTRDACRLLCVERGAPGVLRETRFDGIAALLRPGDLLVRNVSRVLPARLLGHRQGGGRAEIFLLEPAAAGTWWALARPGRRLPAGARVQLDDGPEIVIEEVDAQGRRRVSCSGGELIAVAERHGQVPLPPYIARPADARDRDDYQTVYARSDGSIAAPTAGLHFTPELLQRLEAEGVGIADVVLHVGWATFAPLRLDAAAAGPHPMHSERFEIAAADCARIEATRTTGGRVVAVGTTVVRTLESWRLWRAGEAAGEVTCSADGSGGIRGETRLLIRPPAVVASVDALVTNFHLPRTTLLWLVEAFAGTATARAAYAHAIAERFRFYSYGDAMWIA